MKCNIIISLLFFLIALAIFSTNTNASSLYRLQKEIEIDGDRRIVIKTPSRILIITRPKYDDGGVKVILKTPERAARIILIDRNREILKDIEIDSVPFDVYDNDRREDIEDEFKNKKLEIFSDDKTTSSFKTLIEIFRRYRGVLTETHFCQLLREIQKIANDNVINPIVLYLLKDFTSENSCVSGTLRRDSRSDLFRFGRLDDLERPREYDIIRDDRRDLVDLPLIDERLRYPSLDFDDTLKYDRSFLFTGTYPNHLYRKSERFLTPFVRDDLDTRKYEHEGVIDEIHNKIIDLKLRVKNIHVKLEYLTRKKLELKHNCETQHETTKLSTDNCRVLDRLDLLEKKLIREELEIDTLVRKLQEKVIYEEKRLDGDLHYGSGRYGLRNGNRYDYDYLRLEY